MLYMLQYFAALISPPFCEQYICFKIIILTVRLNFFSQLGNFNLLIGRGKAFEFRTGALLGLPLLTGRSELGGGGQSVPSFVPNGLFFC